MKTIQRLRNVLTATGLSAALALGVMSLLAPDADAKPRPPGPLCGPSFQWSCTGVGGPSVLFLGTVCDKDKFEKKTGKTCVKI